MLMTTAFTGLSADTYCFGLNSVLSWLLLFFLYMWFNLVYNRTVVVLDAALNPHQLLLLMSPQRD